MLRNLNLDRFEILSKTAQKTVKGGYCLPDGTVWCPSGSVADGCRCIGIK